jgi:DNA-binding NtrC family response regulator
MAAQIVYIDDEPMLCRAFRAVMASEMISVETFTDPIAALEYIGSHDVALVFCDYRMPRLTGLEVLEHVPSHIAFVLISGDIDVAASAGRNVRVSSVLSKPYRPDEVLAVARRYFPRN